MKTWVVLVLVMSAAASAVLAEQGGSTPPPVPVEVLKKAAERAKVETGDNFTVEFDTDGSADPATSVPILTSPSKGKRPVAGTDVRHDGHPPNTDYTHYIVIYTETIDQNWPGARRDNKRLEEILYLALCHEMEHMPENHGPHGNTPKHPTDKGGDESDANKCVSIRQYQRDCDRACASANAAMTNPQLTPQEKCNIAHDCCAFHKHIQGLANTPLYAGAAPNCVPAVAVTNGEVVTRCLLCDVLECPITSWWH